MDFDTTIQKTLGNNESIHFEKSKAEQAAKYTSPYWLDKEASLGMYM